MCALGERAGGEAEGPNRPTVDRNQRGASAWLGTLGTSDKWHLHGMAEFTAVGDTKPRALGEAGHTWGADRSWVFTMKDPKRWKCDEEGPGSWSDAASPDTGRGLGRGQGNEGGSACQVPGLWPPAQHPAPSMVTFRDLSSVPVLLCLLQGLMKSLVGGLMLGCVMGSKHGVSDSLARRTH